jgi:parvulin-like peptidyl-prolyl isomerase
MEVGQTSDIIESDLGYHILVLKARKKDRVKPLSEVWQDIEDELFQKKLQEVHKKWVDELKKKAHIQIY